jgi:peptide/nickel transport system substrate-binding protein
MPGGTLRLIYWNAPPTMIPYFVSTVSPARVFAELTLDGLARVAPDGSYLPILAAEIPTQANGDISADGRVVTWKLKPGISWSDGQPFTSQDLIFTYKLIMDPANPVPDRSDYSVMDSLHAPDDDTLVVTYKQLYAPYRLAFPYVFPAHVFNGQTNIASDPFGQGPTVGTGPFVVTSASPGDTLTFTRNPRYREPGKPLLDQVIVRFTPDKATEIPALEAGDVDAALSLTPQTDLPQIATLADVSADPVPSPTVEVLSMNLSCSQGPQQGDPACPHPVLGDLRVRQAIDLAIDKQSIVHGLSADTVTLAESLLPIGPYEVNLPATRFNPDQARQLLDQAGWVVGSDGIRTKGTVRASLSLTIPAGGTISPPLAQVVQGNLQDVGIETQIKESTALSGGFVGNSPFNLGNFDLVLSAPLIPTDPQSYLQGHYASDQVPNVQLQTGNNFARIQDPRIDAALSTASATLDDGQRQGAYETVSQLLHADEVVIPLFSNLQVDARKNYVHNLVSDVNDMVGWNSQDWWLSR